MKYKETLHSFFSKYAIPGQKLSVKKVVLVYSLKPLEEIEKQIEHHVHLKQEAILKQNHKEIEHFDEQIEKLEERCNEIRERTIEDPK
jgi:hypothetical protein